MKPSAFLLDVGNSSMLCIGNLMLSMVITLAMEPKIIPVASMVLVPLMMFQCCVTSLCYQSVTKWYTEMRLSPVSFEIKCTNEKGSLKASQ